MVRFPTNIAYIFPLFSKLNTEFLIIARGIIILKASTVKEKWWGGSNNIFHSNTKDSKLSYS